MTRFAQPPGALDRAAFISRFGDVYAHNPWVAAAVFDAGAVPDTVAAMAAALRVVVEATPESAQRTMLRAYPAMTLPPGSDPAVETTFQRLTAAYRARFDFPFVIAMDGLPAGAVVERLAERLGNGPAAEFRVALDEMHRVAAERLAALALGN